MDEMSSRVADMHVIRFGDSPVEIVLFGYQIPSLPDFMKDHTLLGQTQTEKLQETLIRFSRFVLGLRKYPGCAYMLRYLFNPKSGKVDIFILGRYQGLSQQSAKFSKQASAGLDMLLTAYQIPHIPLSGAIAEQPGFSLKDALQPFQDPVTLVEVRQHEAVVTLHTVGQKAYALHPYWKPDGSLLEVFEGMLRLPAQASLSIYLEPTALDESEYNSISEAAHLAETVADYNLPAKSDRTVARRHDPQAEQLGRIYSSYLNSLTEPFLVLVQAASPDPDAAYTAARLFEAAMTIHTDQPGSGLEERSFPSSCDLFTPTSQEEKVAALRIHKLLIWSIWGSGQATPDKKRLPYLAGARGASAVFRFPVSVQGGIPGVAVRQAVPDFEPGPRPEAAGAGELHLGQFQRGGAAIIRLKDLTRHALITGFTGSGKTNTVLYLLDQLWRNHRIPFLVIEAAKKEYRALARIGRFEDDLMVFTLGDETTSPFRINPFELIPGVRLEAHINKLQACFDAALPQFGILPSIIAESMEEIYKEKNWKLTDRAVDEERRIFPTMKDLLAKVFDVVDRRGYSGETYQNIRAAAAGRIGSLLRGSRGRMFGTQRSLPVNLLLSRPVVLELNDLNEDDKALVMMFLLTWLREYRELHQTKELQHVTVVEEAHNVLSNTQSVGNTEVTADTKAKSVAAFTSMLAEVRAYGEGLIISDQSPEKLAPDAMRNTNLQIAHQLRDQHDREAIARAMIMDEAQREFLGKLEIGWAAYFRTGLEKATFIKVPPYKDQAGFDQLPTDEEVRKNMDKFQKTFQKTTFPNDGCRFCKSQCSYREAIEPFTLDRELHERLIKAMKRFDEQPEPESFPHHWQEIVTVCQEAALQAGKAANLEAAYCYFAHEVDFPFTENMRRAFETSFTEL